MNPQCEKKKPQVYSAAKFARSWDIFTSAEKLKANSAAIFCEQETTPNPRSNRQRTKGPATSESLPVIKLG